MLLYILLNCLLCIVACCLWVTRFSFLLLFFFNDTATTEIYTLSLHDALPISSCRISFPLSMIPTCVQISWISDSTCELRIIVSPFSFSSCSTALRAFTPLGSDRKSTRLNSSHALISYAVFCLKKKIGRAHV